MSANPTTTEPDEIDLRFAAELASILEKAKGGPLTAEELARCHQHVATAHAIFDVEMGRREQMR